mgnify:FL=1
MEYTIDATGKALGRVASEAAKILLAKNTTTIKKNVVANVTVRVKNVSALNISEKKRMEKAYHAHSGYPGSDRSISLAHIIATKGAREALRRAVSGMLPKNTLREKRLKQLIIGE